MAFCLASRLLFYVLQANGLYKTYFFVEDQLPCKLSRPDIVTLISQICVHHDLNAENEKVHLSGTYGKTFMPNFVKFSLLVEESTVQM